mmetsp:Transcript_21045/g.49981  ORF Transcript_21045/g.49981 Transcript_21045/m.49981 type:complete len:218 (-) Transcript_21045:808-1461(-)
MYSSSKRNGEFGSSGCTPSAVSQSSSSKPTRYLMTRSTSAHQRSLSRKSMRPSSSRKKQSLTSLLMSRRELSPMPPRPRIASPISVLRIFFGSSWFCTTGTPSLRSARNASSRLSRLPCCSRFTTVSIQDVVHCAMSVEKKVLSPNLRTGQSGLSKRRTKRESILSCPNFVVRMRIARAISFSSGWHRATSGIVSTLNTRISSAKPSGTRMVSALTN